MKNLSGDASNWINSKNSVVDIDNEEFNPIQRAKDIKFLKSEINFKIAQIKNKVKLLYSMEKTKETYDFLVSIESLHLS